MIVFFYTVQEDYNQKRGCIIWSFYSWFLVFICCHLLTVKFYDLYKYAKIMYVSYALLSFHLILEWILEGSETSKTLSTMILGWVSTRLWGFWHWIVSNVLWLGIVFILSFVCRNQLVPGSECNGFPRLILQKLDTHQICGLTELGLPLS